MNANFENIMVGENVILGSYPQGANGEVLPIVWEVLAVQDDRVLVVSRDILDAQPFHSEEAALRWEDCALRAWLNGEFMNAAFSGEELESVCDPEPVDDPMGGFLWSAFGLETATDSIGDRVFLLSMDDIDRYFPDEDEDSLFCSGESAQFTQYAAAKGNTDLCWWLRSSMAGSPMAYIISPCNSIGMSRISANNAQGVRPAMWLKR